MSSFRDKVGVAWDTVGEKATIQGVDVEIRSMSVADKTHMLKAAATAEGLIDVEKWYPMAVLACCFDPETGEKAFTEADLAWLVEKDYDVIVRLAQQCLSMSAMGPGKVVDEAGKDS